MTEARGKNAGSAEVDKTHLNCELAMKRSHKWLADEIEQSSGAKALDFKNAERHG